MASHRNLNNYLVPRFMSSATFKRSECVLEGLTKLDREQTNGFSKVGNRKKVNFRDFVGFGLAN